LLAFAKKEGCTAISVKKFISDVVADLTYVNFEQGAILSAWAKNDDNFWSMAESHYLLTSYCSILSTFY
jgi:hypothetical protein